MASLIEAVQEHRIHAATKVHPCNARHRPRAVLLILIGHYRDLSGGAGVSARRTLSASRNKKSRSTAPALINQSRGDLSRA
jgi:hypothetical protein